MIFGRVESGRDVSNVSSKLNVFGFVSYFVFFSFCLLLMLKK